MTGLFSALNLTCLTIAYQNDKSATVSLLAYIALVYAFCADIFIFKNDLLWPLLDCLLYVIFVRIATETLVKCSTVLFCGLMLKK